MEYSLRNNPGFISMNGICKMCFANEIIAVDLRSEKYVIYKKNRKEFKRLRNRHRELMKRYQREKKKVSEAYKESFHNTTTLENWDGRMSLV